MSLGDSVKDIRPFFCFLLDVVVEMGYWVACWTLDKKLDTAVGCGFRRHGSFSSGFLAADA